MFGGFRCRMVNQCRDVFLEIPKNSLQRLLSPSLTLSGHDIQSNVIVKYILRVKTI